MATKKRCETCLKISRTNNTILFTTFKKTVWKSLLSALQRPRIKKFLSFDYCDDNLHKKLKEAAIVYHKTMPTILINDENEIVFEPSDKEKIWNKHLFSFLSFGQQYIGV